MDPRDFAVYGYGGAGGLHVAGYLAELGSVRGIVPLGTLSTTWSAYGCATSDVVHVFERAIQLGSPFSGTLLQDTLAELEREARDELSEEGIDAERQVVDRFVEMKYPLQIHRVEVPVDADEVARPGETLGQKFASIYDQLYGKGSAFEGAGSEIVGCRVVGRGRLPQPRVKTAAEADAGEVPSRSIVWAGEDGAQRLDTRIVPAARAAELSPIAGPAVVAAATTTILVPPGATASTDAAQNLVIDLDAA